MPPERVPPDAATAILKRIRYGNEVDVNNDGLPDRVWVRLRHTGPHKYKTGYEVNLRGVPQKPGGHFVQDPQSRSLYRYQAPAAYPRFFNQNRSASFVPGQIVVDKTTGRLEIVRAMVVEIRESAPTGPVQAELASGERRPLEELAWASGLGERLDVIHVETVLNCFTGKGANCPTAMAEATDAERTLADHIFLTRGDPDAAFFPPVPEELIPHIDPQDDLLIAGLKGAILRLSVL